MEFLIVGDEGCEVRKVFKVMWAGTLPGIATVAAWKSFPHELNLEAQDINRMHMQVMLDIKSIEEAMRESINLWIQRSKRNATLAKLIACLKELNWNDSAERLETEFRSIAGTEFSPIVPLFQDLPDGWGKLRVELDGKCITYPIDKKHLNFINNTEPLVVAVERPPKPVKFTQHYDAGKGKPLALILNIVRFDNKNFSTRTGSDHDVKYMRELFTQLGFEIFPADLGIISETKLNKAMMQSIIQEFREMCEQPENDPSAIVVYVGSHGEFNKIYTSNPSVGFDVYLDLMDDIVNKFDRRGCPSLLGRPKIFVIQTCQEFRSTQAGPLGKRELMPDTIVVTPNFPGYRAYRDPHKGCWMTYCFAYVTMNYAFKHCFQDLLDMTKQMIKQIKSSHDEKQILIDYDFHLEKFHFQVDPK